MREGATFWPPDFTLNEVSFILFHGYILFSYTSIFTDFIQMFMFLSDSIRS